MKKIDSHLILIIIAFILFWCGYFVGYTQYKRNIENGIITVKSEITNINTSEYEVGNSLYLSTDGSLTTEENEIHIDTTYFDTVKYDYYDTLKFMYYRIECVGTEKRQFTMCYSVDSVTWKQIIVEY